MRLLFIKVLSHILIYNIDNIIAYLNARLGESSFNINAESLLPVDGLTWIIKKFRV